MGRGDGTKNGKIMNTHMSEIIERILLSSSPNSHKTDK